MGRSWSVTVACIACCVLYVYSDVSAEQVTSADDSSAALLGTLFGYKPCLDENCEGPSLAPDSRTGDVPEDIGADDSALDDSPLMHCILLRPSAVSTFAEIENMHPGISDVKYKVLEELIDHMYPFSTLKIGRCGSNMKLVDFVILAANSLKTQYVLKGLDNCTYRSSRSSEQPKYPSYDDTKAPCGPTDSSEYVTQGSRPDCHGVTKSPEVSTHSVPTKKPYPDAITEKPCQAKPTEKPCAHEKHLEPCQLNVTEGQKGGSYPGSATESPCMKTEKVQEPYYGSEETEIIAEDDSPYPPLVGSLRGIPGIHYPNYTDIPLTSFSCADKKYIPGFYADLETGCQVFHVCYEHRRESFLCPKGTTFNQPILACDFWYNYNCSLAYEDYAINEQTEVLKDEKIDQEVKELVSQISEEASVAESAQNKSASFDESVLEKLTPFLPVKAVVTELEPVEELVKPVPKVEIVPEPVKLKPAKPILKMEPMSMEEVFAKTVIPLAKVKLATIPVSKLTALKVAAPVAAKLAASKVKAAAAAVPVVAAKIAAKVAVPLVAAKAAAVVVPAVAAKAKVAAALPVVAKAKLAVPVVAKSKLAAASIPVAKVAAAVPKVVAKASIPMLKAKKVASAVPLAKAKVAPALKAKLIKGVGAPLLKAKVLSLPLAKTKMIGTMPLMKAKLAKTAAISPLTKKALALGYLKLLKAKKIPFMG